MTDERPAPTDDQIRIAIVQALEQMRGHSVALTELVNNLNTEINVHRAQIANLADGIDENAGIANQNAEVINENEERAEQARQIGLAKEVITHLFEKSHQYVTVIIGGAFAAYFATLNALAARFTDTELRLSALLMTVSLTIFVMWEIVNMFFIGHHTMKGDYGVLTQVPNWTKVGWYIAILLTLGTALPAIGLSVYVYLRGLGVIDWLSQLG